jgi:hypothetical protein
MMKLNVQVKQGKWSSQHSRFQLKASCGQFRLAAWQTREDFAERALDNNSSLELPSLTQPLSPLSLCIDLN